MPYVDREAQRKYQREWMPKRRSDFFSGRSCITCGSCENLELDHIDPSNKVSHRVWSWSESRRTQELAKCQVLCYDCHLQKTLSRHPTREHGMLAMYEHGKCRCSLCKAAKSLYAKLRQIT